MQLLIQRRQRVGLFGVKFFLATRLELDDEEYRLVTTYHARQAIIFLGDMRRDLFKSFLTAVLATIVLTYVGSYLLWQTVAVYRFVFVVLGLGGAFSFLTLVPFLFLLLWFIAYRLMRETVRIADLIGGRAFKCRSIMDIQVMEEFLRKVAFAIAQMLEDMKNWGGREIVPVAPLIERNYAPSQNVLQAPASVRAPAPSTSASTLSGAITGRSREGEN